MTASSEKAKVALGVSGHFMFSALASGGVQIIGFATFVVIARLVGVAAFGLVALAAFVIDLMQIIGTFGLADAVVQRKTLSDEDADTAFWANLGFGVLLFCVLNLLTPAISAAFSQAQLAPLLHGLSIVFLITPLGAIHTARLSRELRFKSLAFRTMAASVVGSAVGIPMALLGYGAWALVGQRIGMSAAIVVVCWGSVRWRPRPRFQTAPLGEMLQFGGYLSLSNFFLQLNSRAAELLAGLFLGPAAVGFIRVGSRCVEILNQLTFAPIRQISMPIQARVHLNTSDRETNYAVLSHLSSTVMFPAYFGTVALAGPIVSVLFGNDWHLAADAMRIIAIGVVPLQMNVLIISTLTAAGRSGVVLIWSSIQIVIALAAAYAVLGYGWQAMLLANVFRAYALLPVGLYLLSKFAGIPVRRVIDSLWRALLCSVAMCAAVSIAAWFLQRIASDAIILLVLVPAGALLYIGSILTLDSFARDFIVQVRRRGSRTSSHQDGVEAALPPS